MDESPCLRETPPSPFRAEPAATYESLLKNSQKLLASTQQALERDKQSNLAQLQMIEKRYEEHLRAAHAENELLRKELSRAEVGQEKNEVTLRRMLFEQLDRAEGSAKSVEKVLREQVAALTSQLTAAQSELERERAKSAMDNSELARALEATKRENEYLSRQLQKSVGELKSKLLRTAQQLAKYSQTTKRERTTYREKLDLLLRHTNESEELWLREKQELVSAIAQSEKMQAEKDGVAASQMSIIKAEKESALSNVKDQIGSMIREKDAANKELEDSLASHSEREAALEQEVLRLQTSLSRVIAYSQQREEKLQGELTKLGGEFRKVRENQAVRDDSLLDFTKDFRGTLLKYAGKLASLKESSEKEEQTADEIVRLNSLLKSKEKEIVSLREMYVAAKQTERLHLSKSLSDLETVTQDYRREQGQVIEGAKAALQDFRTNIETCLNGLPEVALTITATIDTVKSLREENERLKTEIEKADTELLQAHQSISALMETVERYESASCGGTPSSEIRIISLEKELTQLRTMKIEREQHLEQEMNSLRDTVREEEARIDELQLELTKAKAVSHLKFSEESRTLHKKFDVLMKTAQRMEDCLLDMKSGRSRRQKVKETKAKVEAEELISLRNEVKKGEFACQQLKDAWDVARTLLDSQVRSLQGELTVLKSRNSQLASLLSDQHTLLLQQAEKLSEACAGQSPSPTIAITAVPASNELTTALQTEVSALRLQIERMTQRHCEEKEEARKAGEGEGRGRRIAGFSVGREMQMQAEKLKQLTMMLDQERQLHRHEVTLMKQEVSQLRSHCLQRYELLHSDRQEVISELRSLLSSASTSETASRKSLYQGIKKMKELISTVKSDKRHGDKLQNLQEELVTFKSIEDKRTKAQEAERETLNSLINKLKDAYAAQGRTLLCEREDRELEMRVMNGRLEGLREECELLRKQRDEVLGCLGNTSETAAKDVHLLLERLHSADNSRVSAQSREAS